MTFWLVDDGPLGLLAQRAQPSWIWPAATIHVVAEVAHAAKRDKSGRRQSLLEKRTSAGEACIKVDTIVAGSAAGDAFLEFRAGGAGADKNVGEDAAIALALHEPDAVVVAMDKHALFRALSELGRGRVASPFELWESLRGDGLISADDFDALVKSLSAGLGGFRPLRYKK
jgi:hypothetical protein